MPYSPNINIVEETDFKRIIKLILRNFKLFFASFFCALGVAFFVNRHSTPLYNISSSILIKEEPRTGASNVNEFLNSSLLGENTNLQNELWIINSSPIIEKTAKNLDLTVTYYSKGKINFVDTYKDAPFRISYSQNHPQPLNVRFNITFLNDEDFQISAKSKNTRFYNFSTQQINHEKKKWIYSVVGKVGELIETPDLAFIVERKDTINSDIIPKTLYGFEFNTETFHVRKIKRNISFDLADRQATVIAINMNCESVPKGIDVVNELMSVYSEQNLERKNHTATITIEYIEKQLSEIADSLSLAENDMQTFLSANQLLNISDQASSITNQNIDLKNQLAELVSRKRYYDYVIDLLSHDDYSNLMLPSSIGIADQLLNDLMSELITAQSQRSNLIKNNQERNPLVQKLGIQIENLKMNISENINAVAKTNEIAIDDMNKRIQRIETEISRLPATQRQLGSIERKFRLNDAIYNYLMEKHAEAKITQASNLPDDVVIEPARYNGLTSPNITKNYLIAFFLGLALPFSYIMLKTSLNNKIEGQEDIEKISALPVLGKIPHNRHKTNNVAFEFPKSVISESFRALRTNLDFYIKGVSNQVIMVTSCLENEGKSFVALNLAMSYAQLGRRTILVDFDLRKPKSYFGNNNKSQVGLSSYMINQTSLEKIIFKSPHEKLDYIQAGILPPNPVELLAHEKTDELFSELKKAYNIIIIDTTPLAQVTDAYLLINHSEIKILISRQNQTLKNVFSIVMKDLRQKNVNNICVVLNDNKIYADQYGYGYGYYSKKGIFSKHKKEKKHTIHK